MSNKLLKVLLPIPFLAACGSASELAYDVPTAPTLDDGAFATAAEAAEAGGFTGYIAGVDGVVHPVTFELSDDQETLTFTLEGQPPLVLMRTEGVDGDANGLWEAGASNLGAFDLDGSRVYLTGDLNGDGFSTVGYAGLFTPDTELPDMGIGTYQGLWSVSGTAQFGSGTMTMNVHFATSTIDGTWTGDVLDADTFMLLGVGGDISGAVTGSTVSGTMTDVTNGTLDYGGAFYVDGTLLGGALGGALGGNTLGGLWSAEDPPEL